MTIFACGMCGGILEAALPMAIASAAGIATIVTNKVRVARVNRSRRLQRVLLNARLQPATARGR